MGAPPLLHTFSEWASKWVSRQPGWLEERWSGVGGEEMRGRSKILGFWGQGIQAAPLGSPVTANDAELEELEGGGGLKMVSKWVWRERKAEKHQIFFWGGTEARHSPLTAKLTTPLQLLLFHPSPPAPHTHQPPLPSFSSSLQQSQAAVLSVSSLPDAAAVVKQRERRERERRGLERAKEKEQRRGDSGKTDSRGLDSAVIYPKWCICSLIDLLLLFPLKDWGWISVQSQPPPVCHFVTSSWSYHTQSQTGKDMSANMSKHASHIHTHLHAEANKKQWRVRSHLSGFL